MGVETIHFPAQRFEGWGRGLPERTVGPRGSQQGLWCRSASIRTMALPVPSCGVQGEYFPPCASTRPLKENRSPSFQG